MGMYNRIKLGKDCPNCGAKVEWQSKGIVLDGIYPIENCLETFELNKRISGEVYTSCRKCGNWSEVIVKNGKLGKIKSEKHNKRFQNLNLKILN
jgi:hypothetical protein